MKRSKTNRRVCSRLAGCLMVGLGLGLPVAAQQPGPLPGVFGEVLDVRVVNLEVVVTDKDGVPVLGLGPEDFRLEVDGEQTPIDYFTEVRGGTAVEQRSTADAELPGVPALAPGGRVETSYLLFIDDFFAMPNDRNRVLEALKEDLPLLAPEDRMAVVAYDGRDLEMLASWSSSVPELERVLTNAALRPARGLHRVAERRRFLIDEELALLTLAGDASLLAPRLRTDLTPEERSYVQMVSDQLDRSVTAVSATLRSFAKPPGRKVLLLLSGGWPFLPTDFLLGDFSRAILDREGLEGEHLYRRLVDTANLLGYTIYPVDVPGLSGDLVDLSEGASVIGAPGVSTWRGLVREQELHYTLHYLAEQTGGRALLNANRLEAFERAVSDTRSYYWLGFTPGRAWDDARHDVRVLSTAGYRVRSRTGYLDTSRQREVTMAVESALLFGNASTEGGIEATAGKPRKDGRRRMEVPLKVLIPLDQVTVLPVGERYVAELELRVAVRDDRGRRAEIPVVPIVLESPTSPTPGQLGRFETVVRLRRAAHEAVVAVYDPASGRILSAGLEISP